MPLVARDGDHCANTRLCMCAERPDREGESAKHGSDSRGARSSGMSRMRSAWRQLRAKRLERAPELGKRVPTRQVAELGQLSSSVDLQVPHVEPSDSCSCQPVDESRERRAYGGGMKRDISQRRTSANFEACLYIESTLLHRFCGTRRANCASARPRLLRSLFLDAQRTDGGTRRARTFDVRGLRLGGRRRREARAASSADADGRKRDENFTCE